MSGSAKILASTLLALWAQIGSGYAYAAPSAANDPNYMNAEQARASCRDLYPTDLNARRNCNTQYQTRWQKNLNPGNAATEQNAPKKGKNGEKSNNKSAAKELPQNAKPPVPVMSRDQIRATCRSRFGADVNMRRQCIERMQAEQAEARSVTP